MSSNVITPIPHYQAYISLSDKAVSQQTKFYELSGYFLEYDEKTFGPESKGYKVLQALAWYMSRGLSWIARSAIGSFAKCHIDTVSKHTVRFARAGFLDVTHRYPYVNKYSTEMLLALKAFFGYLNHSEFCKFWGVTSVLDLKDNSLTILDSKWAQEVKIFNQSNPKKESLLSNSRLFSKSGQNFTPGLRPNDARVCNTPGNALPTSGLRVASKPYDNTIVVGYKDQMQSVNVNLLFEDLERKAEIKEIVDRRAAQLAKKMERDMVQESERNSKLTLEQLRARLLRL